VIGRMWGKERRRNVNQKPSCLARVKEFRTCHPERSGACCPPKVMKVAVILSEAEDLQFRGEANYCRSFALLRMTCAWFFYSVLTRGHAAGGFLLVEAPAARLWE
jgi:hypothetical protein